MEKAEKHLLMIWEKVKLPTHIRNEIASTIDEIRVKNSVVLADVVGRSEQLFCDDCGYEINPAGICINMNCSTNENP